MTQENSKANRTLIGRVTSDKMNKTVTVLVERNVQHPIYKKYVVHSKKYHAHVEVGVCKTGDLVEIVETKPISKTKAWAVTKVLDVAVVE